MPNPADSSTPLPASLAPASVEAPVGRIVARLSGLRGRVRRILAFAGIGRWLAWAGALVALWFLADLTLDLPLAVRRFVRLGLLDRPHEWGVLVWLASIVLGIALFAVAARHRSALAGVIAFVIAGIPGVLVFLAARHLVAPLRLPLSDEALAGSLEARYRALKDRVAAALDFHRELAHPSRAESASMMASVVTEAGVEVDRVEVAAVASARIARRSLLIGAAVLTVTSILFASMAGDVGLWARRALALEDVGWPRRTTVLAIVVDASGEETAKDPTTPYVAALGHSLVIFARAEGRVPADVSIVDRIASDDASSRPLSHRMRAVSDRAGRFEHEFRDVRGDFTFTLRGGDDDDDVPVYRVVVRVPPRVVGLRTDLTFPPYLSLPTRRVEGGVVTVPEGTKVAVTFSSDAAPAPIKPGNGPTKPGSGVARAEAWVGDAAVDVGRDGEAFGFSFVATATTRFRVRIVTGDGRENDAAADTYEVTVEPDTPPRAEWVFPRAGFATTPTGRIPLFLDTVDDHGVTSLRLEVLGGAVDIPKVIPLSLRNPDGVGENDRAYGAGSILSYVPLEVASSGTTDEPLTAPSRLLVRAVATDAKGQETAGPWLAVDVLRPDELERTLAAQRSRAKTDVEAVRDDVRTVEAVLTALAAQESLTEPDRMLLRDVAHKTGKARADADRVGRTVTSIFLTHAYGRLAAEAPTTTLLALLDRRHRATFTRATDARGASSPTTPMGVAVASAGGEGDVFPWALFREVVVARRDRVLFDTGVLDRMVSVVEHLLEAADVRGPAAATRATSVAREATSADVTALRDAVTAWRTSLDAALTAMAEWQSLAELTLFVRRLVEEQERIDKDIEGLDATGATRRKDGSR